MTHDLVTDGTIVSGAVTAPWWLPLFNAGVQEFLLLGAGVLLTLRLALAYHQWRHRADAPPHEGNF